MKPTPVFLNVYDLDFSELIDVLSASKIKSLNTKTIPLGFGAFHSGLEIYGKEISFSIREGIHVIPPRTAVGAQFRESILLGETEKTPAEFIDILEQMLQKYQSHSYHVFSKNCNHFTHDLTLRLLGVNTPSFLNRLSQFLKHCTSIIPDSKLGNFVPGPPLTDETMVDYLDKEVLLCVLMEEKASYYQCSIPEDQKTDEAKKFLSLLLDPNLDEGGSILAIKSPPSIDISVVSFPTNFHKKKVDFLEEKLQNDKNLFSDEKSLSPTEKSLTPTEKSLTPTEKSPRRLSKLASRLRSRSVPKPQVDPLSPPPLFHSAKNKPIGILKPSQLEFYTPRNSEDSSKIRSPRKSHVKSPPVRVKKSSRNWFRKEKEEIPEKVENMEKIDFSDLRFVKDDRLSDGESLLKSPKNFTESPKISNSKSPRNSGKFPKFTKKGEESTGTERDGNPKPTKKGEESTGTERDGNPKPTKKGEESTGTERDRNRNSLDSRSARVFKRFSRKFPEDLPPGSQISMLDHEPRSFRKKIRSFGLHQNSGIQRNTSQKIQKKFEIPEVIPGSPNKAHSVIFVVDEKEEGETGGVPRLRRCNSDPGQSDTSWSKKSAEFEENLPDFANSEQEREISEILVSRIPENVDGNYDISSSWPSPKSINGPDGFPKGLSKSEPPRKKDGITQNPTPENYQIKEIHMTPENYQI